MEEDCEEQYSAEEWNFGDNFSDINSIALARLIFEKVQQSVCLIAHQQNSTALGNDDLKPTKSTLLTFRQWITWKAARNLGALQTCFDVLLRADTRISSRVLDEK